MNADDDSHEMRVRSALFSSELPFIIQSGAMMGAMRPLSARPTNGYDSNHGPTSPLILAEGDRVV
jgi:hypothetical protein